MDFNTDQMVALAKQIRKALNDVEEKEEESHPVMVTAAAIAVLLPREHQDEFFRQCGFIITYADQIG